MFRVFLCVARQHDGWLVAVASLVCVPAAFATFFLYSQAPAFPRWRRWAGMTMTGLVAGSGIWTTHFVAMLAFKTGLPTGFDAAATAASFAIAVVSATLGFSFASRSNDPASVLRAGVGGGMVGAGVTLMHYVGMAGYRTAGHIHWDYPYVLASVLVGSSLAAAALVVVRHRSNPPRIAAAAALLSLAIVGMHFTGMTAVVVVPDRTVLAPSSLLSDAAMAAAAVGATTLILLVVVGGFVLDVASRNGNLKRLREALDVMPEGLAFFDACDRLVAWNTRYADYCLAGGTCLTSGMLFADILRSLMRNGAFPASAGREAGWLAERMAVHRSDSGSLMQHTPQGRWLRITDRRTGEGGVVSSIVDITDLKRSEAAMAAARDRAEELARRADAAEAVAGLGHWRLDAATLEVTWSDQMYRIYGLAPGDPIDLETVKSMTHPDDAEVVDERMRLLLLDGGAEVNSLTRIVMPRGGVRHLLVNSEAERGADGRVVSVIGTALDVTARTEADIALKTSEERFRRLSINAPDMITEFQLDGVMTYVSPASASITGFAPEELIGQSVTTLMNPEDAQRVLSLCEAMVRSKASVPPSPIEFRANHKDGRELWLECKPALSLDPVTGRFKSLIDVVRDITPRKVLEAELRQARADAEAAAAVKAEFLANMSHELRTPLTSVIGFAVLAAKQSDLSEVTRDYIDRVANASRALLCTVNDILDFSKLEAGQVALHPEPVVVEVLCRTTLDLFTPQAAANDLSLVLDVEDADLVVALDPDRIRQILLNLVSNAVKFTRVGSVTLKTRYDARAQRLTFKVIDTGPGLTPEQQACLFKRFSQIDGSLTRAQTGTGLGLAICKGLANAMEGEVGVESRIGEGSVFWLEIPAPPADLTEVRRHAQGVEEVSLAGLRVLVVDDNPANRLLAGLFLEGAGVEVAEAVNGQEAAERAMSEPYGVILMDVQMPVMNGPSALRRIRSLQGPNQATPVLAFTADAATETRAALLAQGFCDVVAKPVDPAALITAVGRASLEAGRPSQDAA